MGDSYSDHQQIRRNQDGSRDDSRAGFRGGRGPGGRGQGGREGGGFRIRLSDNEMRAARSVQEAFNLRSTVAALGFSIRTIGQMLEEGKLDELVAQSRAQGNSANNRRNDERQGNRRNFDGNHQSNHRGAPKPNPFARPEKPLPVPQQDDDGLEQQALESDNDSGNEQLESNDEAQESTIKSNEEEKSISSNES